MRDYIELVKALMCCVDGSCEGCPRLQTPEGEFDCKNKLKTDAADAIEELVAAVPKWISVEERLPHYLDHVLCINKFGIQMVGYLTDYKEGGFRCESGMDSCDYIAHWMPLPDPPKEDVNDVAQVMMWFAGELSHVGHNHDFTKKSQERMFYRDFLATMNDGASFTDGEWYQLHAKAERHHLFSHCPEDVNLIDVLEMLADCVCAGMARSGEIRSLEIDNEILRKAVSNTVELIKSMIVVEVSEDA